MKKIFLLTIVCILLIFAGTVSATEEITFIAGEWMNDNIEKEFPRINGYNPLELFEEETGIKVKLETYPFAQLFQVIEVKMKGKSADCDVLEVDSPVTSSYAVRGYIEPIDDLLPKEEQKKFFPATVGLGTWQGKIYSMPFENSTQFMYYNKDLFEKAGISFPSMDVNQRWTWGKIVEVTQKIQKTLNKEGETKIWGLLFDQVNRPYQMLALPQSLGAGSGVSPDGLHVEGYLNNEGWIKAMTWWYNVNNVWKIHPKGIGPAESPEQFIAGNVAIFIGGSWNMSEFEETREEGHLNYGIAPHPYFTEGKPATGTNSWHFGISPYSKHKEAAKKFVKFLTSEKIMGDWFKATKQLTANKVMNEVIFNLPEYREYPLNAFKEITTYELEYTAEPRPTTPFYLEWEDLVGKAFGDIQNGADPKTTLDEYAATIERVAKKYRE